MSTPEEALDAARRSAAQMRAAGAYGEAGPLASGPPSARESERRLYQWALIEPDLSKIGSTRRLGAPVTAVKRLLLRLLLQYHMQLLADQSRFNAVLLRYVRRLEDRVAELEARLGGDPPS